MGGTHGEGVADVFRMCDVEVLFGVPAHIGHVVVPLLSSKHEQDEDGDHAGHHLHPQTRLQLRRAERRRDQEVFHAQIITRWLWRIQGANAL